MAITTERMGGGGGRFGRQRRRPMSEINVTPFVDVMLVLLIIFMVTAPLLTVGVEINLPETKAGAIAGEDEPLAISIDNGGQIFLQDTQVPLETLVPRLRAITGENRDLRIFVRGDSDINYGRVMEVMGTINRAGYRRVALITRSTDKSDTKTDDNKAKKQP
ncbi:MAG: protein TolR [Rhodospirillales bacterium]|jgi:biopolymer transport protein TolR|nr:protein TolR [Rhodospirillales bacterium]